jgi:hypothetical protein
MFLAAHPLWKRWVHMVDRCTNPGNPNYADYGGRGIGICERWTTFECFAEDVGLPPSAEHTLDRKDNAKGYSPDNVRWATKSEQARNRRSCVFGALKGKKVYLRGEAEKRGISPEKVLSRVRCGWSTEEALGIAARPSALSPSSFDPSNGTLEKGDKPVGGKAHTFQDLEGKVFGRWKVLHYLGSHPEYGSYWACQCSCGKIKAVCGKHLRSGKSRSCGCLHKDYSRSGDSKRTHGETQTPTYVSWTVMKRSQQFDPSWASYEQFKKDMGEKPDGLVLRRKARQKPYSKRNCFWGPKGKAASAC